MSIQFVFESLRSNLGKLLGLEAKKISEMQDNNTQTVLQNTKIDSKKL